MQKFVALSVLLGLLAVAYVSAQEKACRSSTFVKVEECCNMPKITSKEAFADCIGNKTKAAKKAQAGFLQSFRSYHGLRGGVGGAACMQECVMQKHSLLLPSGEADEAKIMTKLTEGSDAAFKTLVADAGKKCSADIANLDLSNVGVPVNAAGQVCKIRPGLFLTCVKWILGKNCPANKRVDAKTNKDMAAMCDTKTAQMKQCSPLSLVDGDMPMLRPYKVKTKGKKQG